ncbi:hypothetical protein E1180_19275 [Roseibium denhamense]|uniref:Papain-like cysteine peptidase n=1 Tax=Roseibium denhamense TaxID=76305 RepID=A0ABY1P3B5_9HYPH|nr:hypothetical protein [Roseibium denhamense]MTI07647.1 hypothetical protein [Roseibium denhamense]SMP24296.1 hypothetical protein SAMN06265374_2413 [Roseibium denhamense]
MSIGDSQTAIISLGISCQSARQIRDCRQSVSGLLGADLQPERHFFDGLISPLGGLAQLFADGFPMFERDSLTAGPGHPTWNPYGFRFLHHFRDAFGRIDLEGSYRHEHGRFSHLKTKFDALRSRARIVFVISNSQNNLDEVGVETGVAGFDFRSGGIDHLQRAVDAYLGRSCEFLIVSYPERCGDLRHPNLYLLTRDQTEWVGDKAQWRAVFSAFLGQGAGALRSAG